MVLNAEPLYKGSSTITTAQCRLVIQNYNSDFTFSQLGESDNTLTLYSVF